MKSTRTRLYRSLALVASFVAATGAAVVPASAANAADPCNGNWTPTASGFTVSQGLGTYPSLIRGKTTIARLFLSQAPCAPDGTEQLVSASVTATDGATVLVDAQPTAPASLGPTYPTLSSSTAAQDPTNPANPTFRLAAFAGADPNQASFTAVFTFTYHYQYRTSSSSTTWLDGGQVQVTSLSGSVGPLTASVAPPTTKPLRLLVVPMGDRSQVMTSQFPERSKGGTAINNEYADDVVRNAMLTLSREMPVPDGVGDLAGGAGGIRYHLDDKDLLDLGPNGLDQMTYGNGHQFCLSQNNFIGSGTVDATLQPPPNVSSLLTNWLNSWNSTNPGAQADAVLGVVWQTISLGSTTCDEGRAALPASAAAGSAPVAVIRLLADQVVNKQPAPSLSGSLASMEVSHLFGDVPYADPRDVAHDYHSSNQSADPTKSGTAYNTDTGAWLGYAYSSMHYSGYTGPDNQGDTVISDWNNTDTVYEREDYAFDACVRTSGMSPDPDNCPLGAAPGTSAAAGNDYSLDLSGTTDGTRAGTYIHSYHTDTATDLTREDPASTYRLVELDADHTQVLDWGVPVETTDSEHSGSGPDAVADPTKGTIAVAAPLASGVASFELWNGEPGTGVFLFGAAAGPRPQVTSTSGGASLGNVQDFSDAAGDDTGPALSPHGTAVAWATSAGIAVARRDATTNRPADGTAVGTLPLPATDAGLTPTWSPSGATLAYATTQGDVYTVAVSVPPTGAPSFGAPSLVYNHLVQTPPPGGSTLATHPSYSPDAKRLAIAVNGYIWSIDAASSANPVVCDLQAFTANAGCQALTPGTTLIGSGGDAWPSWGANGLVAYEHGQDVWTVDAASGQQTLRVANASRPAWGSNLLGFVRGGVWVANSSVTGTDGAYTSLTPLTSGASDTDPALARDAGALAFERPVTGNGTDVYDGTLSTVSSEVSFTATTAGDANRLRADLFDYCTSDTDPAASVSNPVITAVPPTSVSPDGHSASWTVPYDTARGCPGSQVTVRISDGYNLSDIVVLESIPSNGPNTPPAVPSATIGVPYPGAVYRQYDVVFARASSIDPATGTNTAPRSEFDLFGPDGSRVPVPDASNTDQVELDPHTPGGWALGTYTLTYVVTNDQGLAGTATTEFTVVADPQHRGVNVTIDFNPQTLYVPSSGNDVTLYVAPNGQDLSQITPSTVRIAQVGGAVTDIPVDTTSGTNGWVSNHDGTYTAKFSRQALTCAMNAHGLTGGYVPVYLTASALSKKGAVLFSISGFDPNDPTVTPADPPITC